MAYIIFRMWYTHQFPSSHCHQSTRKSHTLWMVLPQISSPNPSNHQSFFVSMTIDILLVAQGPSMSWLVIKVMVCFVLFCFWLCICFFFSFLFVFLFFGLYLGHAEVPRPGIEPIAQQRSEHFCNKLATIEHWLCFSEYKYCTDSSYTLSRAALLLFHFAVFFFSSIYKALHNRHKCICAQERTCVYFRDEMDLFIYVIFLLKRFHWSGVSFADLIFFSLFGLLFKYGAHILY